MSRHTEDQKESHTMTRTQQERQALLAALTDLLGSEKDFAVDADDELSCLGCGRRQPDLDFNTCEASDCPRYRARLMIAQAEGRAA